MQYYFDENGNQLTLGVNLNNPQDAAYTTNDPEDVIFQSIPKNMMWKIVDGAPTITERPLTPAELHRFNRQQLDNRIRNGFEVTGTFVVNGDVITSRKEVINITPNIKSDVNSLMIAYALPGFNEQTLLTVKRGVQLVFNTKEQVTAFFLGGMQNVKSVYKCQADCEKIIRDEPDPVKARNDIIDKWAEVNVKVTIPT